MRVRSETRGETESVPPSRRLKSLVARARLGDMGAFADLVRGYQRLAWGYAYARTGDAHLAEDVCQETFVDAYCKLGELRHPEAFPVWLRRIVRKHADRVTRRRREVPVPHLGAEVASTHYDPPEGRLERSLEIARLGEIIGLLPEGQRAAATLCYVDGCRIEEIAAFLDISPGTVRKRLFDARKRIAQFYRTEDVSKMEHELSQLLETHLSPRLVKKVLAEPSVVKTQGERRTVTALFVDAIGMDKILGAMEAQDAVRYLNTYLEALHQVILDHDGFMDKVMGDEIMAFWGAPLSDESHAERACSAALAIQRKLEALNKEYRGQGKPPIRAGIGINTGEVIIGTFGPKDHPAYTPLGSAVNLAGRMERETRAHDSPIVISQFTYEAVASRFKTKHLGEIDTRAFEEPIGIYALLE
jgi:RNA polymerase sigma factor (sigma-70 family)